ncbi:hypothetical protein WS63_33355 [Burkholderia stagnalis]|nr:hypothetical protein WS63_33355 [Burkholderia stagnalis]
MSLAVHAQQAPSSVDRTAAARTSAEQDWPAQQRPEQRAADVDPMDAKDLAPELQWIDSQKANKGLFDYTLIQQGKDLGPSQFDQFKRGVLVFGEDAKNVRRDVANSRVKLSTDVQQGDANPQIDPNGGGPKTPSGPAGATVTVGAVPGGVDPVIPDTASH